eukprot:GCRY01002948.1.p1 GENE.GCRY01002948.1~~GCRY01002948.1.p1  ORF type:complete len:263 (+),score=60.49 GCRY01002948.1:236-1024(+)
MDDLFTFSDSDSVIALSSDSEDEDCAIIAPPKRRVSSAQSAQKRRKIIEQSKPVEVAKDIVSVEDAENSDSFPEPDYNNIELLSDPTIAAAVLSLRQSENRFPLPSRIELLHKSIDRVPEEDIDTEYQKALEARLHARAQARQQRLEALVEVEVGEEEVAAEWRKTQQEKLRSDPAGAEEEGVSDAPSILLMIRYKNNPSEAFKVPLDKPLEKLHAAFCQKLELPPSTVSLFFDGDKLDLTKGPGDYELEEEDLIDARSTTT